MERWDSLQRGQGAKERSGDQVSSLLYCTQSQRVNTGVPIQYYWVERAVSILEEVDNTEKFRIIFEFRRDGG